MTSTRRIALVLFGVAFAVYVFPLAFDLAYRPFFGYVVAQDVVSASLLPVSVLQRGDFRLDEFGEFFDANWRSPYFVTVVNGQLVSRYPVVAAVLALPFYGVPLGSGWLANPSPGWLFYPWSAFFAAKFAAALMTALAVVMFFFCARELADDRTSVIVAVAFAFGTSVWSSVSQGLWQHTPSLLFEVIAIWFVLRARRHGDRSAVPGALFFSAATIARMNVGIAALFFTVYVYLYHRSAIGYWLMAAIPPALLGLGYNWLYNGSAFVFGYQEGVTATMSLVRPDALIGLLVSPSRGLLVYSPFLILLPPCVILIGRERERHFYVFAALTLTAGILFLSLFEGWDGGWGYGTRLITDVLPFAVLLLVPVANEMSGAWLSVLGVTITWSIVLQSLGLWDYGTRWHYSWPNWEANVWDVARNEPLFYVRQLSEMARRYVSR